MKTFYLIVVAIVITYSSQVKSIQFEQESYQIMEDVGLNNFALRVCVDDETISNETSISIATRSSGNAIAGEDYEEENTIFTLNGRPTCIAVSILEDLEPEMDESFECIIMDESSTILDTATVTIWDDDDVYVHYTGDTPIVRGRRISYNLLIGSGIVELNCFIVFQQRASAILRRVDCSSGSVTELLPFQRSRLSSLIVYTLRNGTVLRQFRTFNLGINGRCSAHLINNGVSFDSNGDVTVEWRLASPNTNRQSRIKFMCELDGGDKFPCTPPQVLRNLRPGSHILVIRSNGRNGGGCRRHIGRTIAFQVPE